MSKNEAARRLILKQRVLPLYYHENALVSIDVMKSLYGAGVRAIEYTNRGENALQNFVAMKREVVNRLPGMMLGIGTIKTVSDAKAFIDADADFIVCPVVVPEVGKMVQDAGLLWVPGCMTPTEINMAENAGAELVKIFPGNVLGPGFIKAVKELFPRIQFMPTGGVEMDRENLQSWFNAGVVAVGVGSKLVSKAVLQNKQYDLLQHEAAKVLALVQSIK